MLKQNHTIVLKFTIFAFILMSAISCSKDDNNFLPYVRVNLHIPLATYNHLTTPGSSVLFQNEGYRGLIVVCVDPSSNQYYAFDATCPNEKDYSGVVMVKAIKNLPSQPGTIFSSDFFGICNKCGSEFNLMGAGQPTKGPATHYLQSYNIVPGFQSLMVTN